MKDAMPPPPRVYTPGTDEYEEALQSGQLHSSIFLIDTVSCPSEHPPEQPEHQHEQPEQHYPQHQHEWMDGIQNGSSGVVSPDYSLPLYEPPHTSMLDLMMTNEKRASSSKKRHASNRGISQESLSSSGTDDSSIDNNEDNNEDNNIDSSNMVSTSSNHDPPHIVSSGDYSNHAAQHEEKEDEPEEGNGEMQDDPVRSDSSAKRQRTVGGPSPVFENTRFSDIIGHAAVKIRVDEILLPLGLPASLVETTLSGIRSQPTSILLYGPPGCGKTQLARAIAGEARAAFFSVAPSDVLSKFVGESEQAIRAMFYSAKEAAQQLDSKCSILFLDEIDALGQMRETGGTGQGDGSSRRVLAELLLQFNDLIQPSDGTNDDVPSRVVVVAATNRPEDCDPALLRRFGIRLKVDLPTPSERRKMILRNLRGVEHTLTKVEIKSLAEATNDWSGSDIEMLSREAALTPVRECLRAAALWRRRSQANLRQPTGQASRPDPGWKEPSDRPQDSRLYVETRSFLEQELQELRPVTIEDFQHALSMITKSSQLLTTESPVTKVSAKRSLHYDSSSDEEEEDRDDHH